MVQRIRHGKTDETVDHLVYLGRMTRNGLAVAYENKTPWQVGRTAVYLTVEQVTQPNHRARQTDAYTETVQYPYPTSAELRIMAVTVFVEEYSSGD